MTALLGRPLVGQLIRFGAIGVVSTFAYVVLYAAFRTALPQLAANTCALLITAIGNTAANRRLTFGVRDRSTVVQHQLAGLVAFGVALAITSGAVVLLDRVSSDPSRALELLVLVGANIGATAVRFVLLRTWISTPSTTHVQTLGDRLEGPST